VFSPTSLLHSYAGRLSALQVVATLLSARRFARDTQHVSLDELDSVAARHAKRREGL
jgi:predicted HD phosphohydrolase